MIKVGITGSDGLIGYHLKVFLNTIDDIELKLANRDTFQSDELLAAFTENLDVIVHLADIKIGSDNEIKKKNMIITKQLTNAATVFKIKPHIIFASSTHTLLNPKNPYSISKIECSNHLKDWSKLNNFKFTNLILPHVFGEFGKPFYNSVISTFCHQLAIGEKTKIKQDKELELLHVQDVAKAIYQVILNGNDGDYRLSGSSLTVFDARKRLIALSEYYLDNLIPDLTNNLDCQLFNTFRSYLTSDYYPRHFDLHADDRGFLYEAVKCNQRGLTFLSITKPGITRGNHYHTHKFERFIVINGKACIKLRKIFSNNVLSYEVDGNQPAYVDIPTYTTHNITNIGEDDLTTLFWSNIFYDEDNSDTYFEEV